MVYENTLAAPRPRRLRVTRLGVASVAAAAAVALAVWVIGAEKPRLLLDLWRWAPHLAQGFAMNLLISVLAIGSGTVLGLALAAGELSGPWFVRAAAWLWVGIFRNAPLLPLIFAASYALPFEVRLFGTWVAFPDWAKAVVALMLPASAHIAEVFRGAVASIPTTQWEAAESLGFGRLATLRWIILPQCVKRSLPPWMNLYSTITMGTSLASLAGVDDLLHAASSASQAMHRTDFTIAVFPVVLVCFFAYCYPIALATRALERRFAGR